jgi:hypothetical protein
VKPCSVDPLLLEVTTRQVVGCWTEASVEVDVDKDSLKLFRME